MGVGLSVVKHTLKECGGKIEAGSPSGEETTFTVSLPACRPDPGEKLNYEYMVKEFNLPVDLEGAVQDFFNPFGKDILIVDDDQAIRYSLLTELQLRHNVRALPSSEKARDYLEGGSIPDILLVDILMPAKKGTTFIREISRQTRFKTIPVLFISGMGEAEKEVQALKKELKRRNIHFMKKPLGSEELLAKIEWLTTPANNPSSNLSQYKQHTAAYGKDRPPIIGMDKGLREVFRQVFRLKKSKRSILLTGETGCGKEVVARAIKEIKYPPRAPFVKINCAAIQTVVESELFGHSKGAFTGADRNEKGLIEMAAGGVLFMDEFGELSLETQAKLLRALENKEVKAVGATEEKVIDFQLIAATNRDLPKMIEAGTFREDLYYRLQNIIPIPPLRERRKDIPGLVEHLLKPICRELEIKAPAITTAILKVLCGYPWSGNMRQLERVLYTILSELSEQPEIPITPEMVRQVLYRQPGTFNEEEILGGLWSLVLGGKLKYKQIQNRLMDYGAKKCGIKEAAKLLAVSEITIKKARQRLQEKEDTGKKTTIP